MEGPFGGVAGLSGRVPRFGLGGGGSGSGGFEALGGFGVFLVIALVLQENLPPRFSSWCEKNWLPRDDRRQNLRSSHRLIHVLEYASGSQQ